MKFHQLIQYKALDQIHTITGSDAVDRLPQSEIAKSPVMRNVCALITLDLFEELEQMCSVLGISKRQFIESSLIESIKEANAITKEVGLHEALWEASHGQPYPGEEAVAKMHEESK